MPDVEVLLTEDAPSPLNPLGLKGAGEGGINARRRARSRRAIDDAIGMPGAVDAAAGHAAAAKGHPRPPTIECTGSSKMHTIIDSRAGAAGDNRAAPNQDLRAWLAALEAAGELTVVRGAEREQEIGGIVDIYQRAAGSPAVLFDDIPGYQGGYRVVANILTSVRRINLTLGLPIDGSAIDLVRYWRTYMKEAKTIPPRTVEAGPLLDNVASGRDIDLLEDPDAQMARARRRLLHRHRLHGDHAGPRHRLDQLRRLSHPVPRPQRRLGDDLEGQARQPNHAPLP